ncbi:MAG: hypothetical protein ABFD54_12980 [Armatimonadota bacterium]|nr:hypothetical protein [bacterium]
MSTTSRELSQSFRADLMNGLLTPVLHLVRADHTLSLNIRNEYMNICYRGGNLAKISRENGGGYTFEFDQITGM